MSHIDTPILITGCARSGTSLTAGIVNHCGAWGGKMTGNMPHNKKGQYENSYIRNNMVKPHLELMGCDKLGQKPLPDINNIYIDFEWKADILKVIKAQGYSGGPWFYKGAKMCLTWPLWHDAFPNAKWVIVRRDDKDIALSCMKTRFMRAYRDVKGWQIWIDEHKKRFEEMEKAGLDVVEVWPSKVIEGKYGEMKNAIHHIGLSWERDIIHDFIEPRLWNTKRKRHGK